MNINRGKSLKGGGTGVSVGESTTAKEARNKAPNINKKDGSIGLGSFIDTLLNSDFSSVANSKIKSIENLSSTLGNLKEPVVNLLNNTTSLFNSIGKLDKIDENVYNKILTVSTVMSSVGVITSTLNNLRVGDNETINKNIAALASLDFTPIFFSVANIINGMNNIDFATIGVDETGKNTNFSVLSNIINDINNVFSKLKIVGGLDVKLLTTKLKAISNLNLGQQLGTMLSDMYHGVQLSMITLKSNYERDFAGADESKYRNSDYGEIFEPLSKLTDSIFGIIKDVGDLSFKTIIKTKINLTLATNLGLGKTIGEFLKSIVDDLVKVVIDEQSVVVPVFENEYLTKRNLDPKLSDKTEEAYKLNKKTSKMSPMEASIALMTSITQVIDSFGKNMHYSILKARFNLELAQKLRFGRVIGGFVKEMVDDVNKISDEDVEIFNKAHGVIKGFLSLFISEGKEKAPLSISNIMRLTAIAVLLPPTAFALGIGLTSLILVLRGVLKIEEWLGMANEEIQNRTKAFSNVVLTISGAIGLFAIGILATSMVFSAVQWGSVFAGLALFSTILIVIGIMLVLNTRFGGKKSKDGGLESFESAAKTMVALGAGLILFAVGIWVLDKIMQSVNPLYVAIGVGLIMIMIWVAGKIAGDDGGSDYAKSVLILAGLAFAYMLMAAAIFLIGVSIKTWGDIGSVVVNLLVLMFLVGVAFFIGRKNTRDDMVIGALILIGLAIAYFLIAASIKLLGNSILTWGGFANIILATLIFGLLVFVAYKLGKDKDDTQPGALIIIQLAIAYLIIAVAVRILGKSITSWEGLGAVALAGAVLYLLYYIAKEAGKNSVDLTKGAVALILIAGAFLIYAVAVKIAATVIDGLSNALLIAGIMMAIFLVFVIIARLVGDPSMSPYVIAGAVALLILAAAFLVFGVAVKLLVELKYPDQAEVDRMWNYMKVLIAVGFMFSSLAIVAPFIIISFIAVTMLSLGLLALNATMKHINKTDWKAIENNILKREKEGGKTRLGKIVEAIADSFTVLGFFGSAKALAGAFVVKVLSKALFMLTDTLKEVTKVDWNKVHESLTAPIKDSKGDNTTKLRLVVKTVADAFSSIEDSEKAEEGASSMYKITLVLGNIGKALQSFQETTKGITFGKHTEPGNINYNIYKTVTSVSDAFRKVGENAGGASVSIFGMSLGIDGPTERGVKAVKGMGDVLSELAKGILAWKDLSNIGLTDQDLQGAEIKDGKTSGAKTTRAGLATNIANVITLLSSAFAGITQHDKVTLNNGYVTYSQDSVVGKGIEAVKGLGKVLSDIANGLKTFKSLDQVGFTDSDFTFSIDDKGNVSGNGVLANIGRVVMAVSSVFAQIGDSTKTEAQTVETGDTNWLGQKETKMIYYNDMVKRGVEAMAGSGNIIKKMADAIKVLAGLGEPDKVKSATSNITSLIAVVGKVFADIGSGKAGFSVEAMQKGIETITGAGDEMKKYADSIAQFKLGKDQTMMDIEKIKSMLGGMIEFTAGKLNQIGGGTLQYEGANVIPDNVKKGIDLLKSMNNGVNEISKLSKSMKGVSEAISGERKSSINYNAINNNLSNIAGLFTNNGLANADNAKITNFSKNRKMVETELKLIVGMFETVKNASSINPNLETLNRHLKGTYDFVKSPIISPNKIQNFKTLVGEFQKIAWAADKFKVFEIAFQRFNETVRKMVDNVNRLQLDKFKGVIDYNKTMIELVKQPQSKYDIVRDYIYSTMDAWFEKIAEYNAQIEERYAAMDAESKGKVDKLIEVNANKNEAVINAINEMKEAIATKLNGIKVTELPSNVNQAMSKIISDKY